MEEAASHDARDTARGNGGMGGATGGSREFHHASEGAGEPSEGGDFLAQIEEQAAEVDRTVRSFVREHPFVSLFGAVAVGFAIGRIATHR